MAEVAVERHSGGMNNEAASGRGTGSDAASGRVNDEAVAAAGSKAE